MKSTILALIAFSTLLTSCMDPGKAKNPAKVVESMAKAHAKRNPMIPSISYEDVKDKQKFVIVDVREKFETDISMIPRAITKTEFEANKKDYVYHEIILYCTIGTRATEYAKQIMQKDGMTVFNLYGGVLGWAHAGNDFVDSKGNNTKKVHLYSEAWNLLPEGYEGIFEQ